VPALFGVAGPEGKRRSRDARKAPGRAIRSGHAQQVARMSALRASVSERAVHASRSSPELVSASQIWPGCTVPRPTLRATNPAARRCSDSGRGGLGGARLERRGQPQLEPPHESTTLFSERLRKLADDTDVRISDGSNRVRKLTPLRLQKLLKEQSPELPVSQTQIYRYYHGEAPPRLDVVFELARLFNVSPRMFADRTGAERMYSTKPKRSAAADEVTADEPGSPGASDLLVRRGQPQLEPPHTSTTYFARQLQKLAADSSVRLLDGSDRVRKLSPLQLQKFLKEQAPDLPVSQTQIYRYYHGEAPPRLDVVFELADLFGVAPTAFLPEWHD
jgi:transcriptional regulator with XRE-family HTH domain